MNETLDRTSKEAVSTLAAALQAGLTGAARETIQEALDGTIDEAAEAIRQLDLRVKSLVGDLQPALCEAIREEIGSMKVGLAGIVDGAARNTQENVAGLVHAQGEKTNEAIQGAADVARGDVRASIVPVEAKLDALTTNLAATESTLKADVAEGFSRVSAALSKEVRASLLPVEAKLNALTTSVVTTERALKEERARLLSVEGRTRVLTVLAVVLSAAAAGFSAAALILR